MKIISKFSLLFYVNIFSLSGFTQQLKLDSLIADFDRICNCKNIEDSSEKKYINCLEKELRNPFLHRTDYLLLSNYWAIKDEQKSYHYAKSYFKLGGYFPSGVDSNLLKMHVQLSNLQESYFNQFYSLALSNEKKRDRILQTNSRIAKAIIELKPYDQFFRGNKNQNLKVWDDSNLETFNWKFQIQLDSLNRKFLSAILDSNWITIDLYGNEANKVAWLIAQHADQDLEFQEKCLELMLKSYPRDRTSSGMHLAYLIDRLSINRHGYQYFGTQFNYLNGEIAPKPIQNSERVSQRRKQVYLPPLENYLESSKEYLEKK